MKMDDAYWTEMFLRFRGSFGNPCIRPEKTMRLLKQIAADARAEQAGKDREAVSSLPIDGEAGLQRPLISRDSAIAALRSLEEK